jgi:F0F1-type ATP synthase membrane subunit a
VVHRSIPSLPLDPRQPHAPKLITNPSESITLNLSLCFCLFLYFKSFVLDSVGFVGYLAELKIAEE